MLTHTFVKKKYDLFAENVCIKMFTLIFDIQYLFDNSSGKSTIKFNSMKLRWLKQYICHVVWTTLLWAMD